MTLVWYGLDFGETIMNPLTLHQSALIRGIYKNLGREGEGEDHVKKWYALRDSVGSRYDALDLRVREVKQYARGRIYSEVLDDDAEIAELFDEGEARGFTPCKGIERALERMKGAGADVSIVSESASSDAVMVVVRFLGIHGLSSYFRELITPAGRFDTRGEMIGPEFVGKTKKDGTIYDQLAAHLRESGIAAKEAVIVGDDPVLDVRNAKERGFVTVQFTGIVNRGASTLADYVISDWDELPGPGWVDPTSDT